MQSPARPPRQQGTRHSDQIAADHPRSSAPRTPRFDDGRHRDVHDQPSTTSKRHRAITPAWTCPRRPRNTPAAAPIDAVHGVAPTLRLPSPVPRPRPPPPTRSTFTPGQRQRGVIPRRTHRVGDHRDPLLRPREPRRNRSTARRLPPGPSPARRPARHAPGVPAVGPYPEGTLRRKRTWAMIFGPVL